MAPLLTPSRGADSGHCLEWFVKESLVRYVEGMSDGSVVIDEPATTASGGFRFAAADVATTREGRDNDGTLRFAGSVTLSGHGGLLRLTFAEPWLVPCRAPGTPYLLTIADPYEAGERINFATIEHLDLDSRDTHGPAIAQGTYLTADGADLFFSGPYTEGNVLDDPRVLYDA